MKYIKFLFLFLILSSCSKQSFDKQTPLSSVENNTTIDKTLETYLDKKFSSIGRINRRLKRSSAQYYINGNQTLRYERQSGTTLDVYKVSKQGNFYYLQAYKEKGDPKTLVYKRVDVYVIRVRTFEELEEHIDNGYDCLINTFI
jgi:superoxide dismutase